MNTVVQNRKSQVRIESKNLDADKTVVETILLAAAHKFNLHVNLHDNLDESRIPHTIRSIVERKGFGFGLGGRVVENSIFVDFNRGRSQSPKFDEVHDFILSELKTAYRIELKEIGGDNPVYCKTHKE